MPLLEDICNWCMRILEQLQEIWTVMVNMFLHDFQYNWVEQTSSVPIENFEFEEVDDNLNAAQDAPMVHYAIENESKKRRRGDRIAPVHEESSKQIEVPVVSRLQYVQSRNNSQKADETTPLVVILEPRPSTEDSPPTSDDSSLSIADAPTAITDAAAAIADAAAAITDAPPPIDDSLPAIDDSPQPIANYPMDVDDSAMDSDHSSI